MLNYYYVQVKRHICHVKLCVAGRVANFYADSQQITVNSSYSNFHVNASEAGYVYCKCIYSNVNTFGWQ